MPHRSLSLTRREALAGGVAASAILATPAIAHGVRALRMVTSWPEKLPGPGVTAERIAERIGMLSGGRLEVEVFPAGMLVPPLEVFDAVVSGTADMAHTASFFWQGKMPASVFFTAMPFGLTAPEHAAWIHHGGGQVLWDALYGEFGVKPFMAGNTGMQMGGWFKREVAGLDDLKGLKIRMPGLGGEVMRRLGATPVSLPPGEIFQALESGVIDATEFLGPWSDLPMGFDRVASYYYWPGWHEPNGTGELIISKEVYDDLPDDLRTVIDHAAAAENAFAVAEADWFNAGALAQIAGEGRVELRPFPDEVLDAARGIAEEVLTERGEADARFGEILVSYRAARDRLAPWATVGTRSFLDARAG